MDINALYDTGSVRRFHTVADYSGGMPQTVADHSWGVALIALELCKRRGMSNFHMAEVLAVALIHDAEEAFTGDMPATTKWRFPKLAEEMRKAEESVRMEMEVDKFELSEEQLAILKWADGLELLAHSLRRARDGATAYAKIVVNIREFMMNNLPRYPEALKILWELENA